MVGLNLAGIRVGNGLGDIAAGNTLFQLLDHLVAVHKGFDLHEGDIPALAAVHLADDQVLGNVYQTSGQVS